MDIWIREHRKHLKHFLLHVQGGGCPWCEELGPTDLHETFLKRGDLTTDRQEELWGLLYCIMNCVVLHNHCHLEHGQTTEMEIKIARYKAQDARSQLRRYLSDVAEAVPTWNSIVWNRQTGELNL